MPTQQDMQTSLGDARFFCREISKIVRGLPEHEQNLEEVRRYFRGYLHCWKSTVELVRKERGLIGTELQQWIEKEGLEGSDLETYTNLRLTRDDDFHSWLIKPEREIANKLYPIVMFQPGGEGAKRRELISCCERGLGVAEWLIQHHLK